MYFLVIYSPKSWLLIHLHLFQSNPPPPFLIDFHACRCPASMPMRDRYLHSQNESPYTLFMIVNECQHYPNVDIA